jgi:TP901 family phage tail tape measure protein
MSFNVGELFVKLDLDSSSFAKKFDVLEQQVKAFTAKTYKVPIQIEAKYKEQITEAANQLKQTALAANQTAQAVRSIEPAKIASVATEARNATTSVSTLGATLRTALAVSVGNILTQPLQELANVFTSIIPSAANFEQGMANIKAVLMPTAAEFQALSDKALQLGRDTQFTATESASAIEMLAKNGLTSAQILDGAADATVAFASATGSQLSVAADVATDAMLSFNLEAGQLPDVINMAVGAMNQSKFGVDDYRLALGQAGGAVGGVGVSLLDFNTVLAATSNRFASGSDAGTSFKTFLLRLNPISKEAGRLMRELGIITADGSNQFFDAAGNVRPFNEIIQVLQGSLGGLTKEAQLVALQSIFGQDAIRTAIGLLDTSTERFNTLQNAIKNTDAAQAAATRMDTFNGAIKILQSSIEGVAISIGNQLLPNLTGIVQSATEVINTLNNIVGALSGSQEAFNNLPPSAQMVVLAFQDISAGIQSAVTFVQSVLDSLVTTIQSYFGDIASSAFGWGSNVGGSFADGISGSINAIIDSISAIGEALSYWLQPGSPPRIAPDIDTWGKETGEEYYKGIGQADSSSITTIGSAIYESFVTPFDAADYSAIDNFVSTVKTIFSNLDISDKDAITQVIGSKESFSAALSEFRLLGSISEETFKKIVDSSGVAGTQVANLTSAYFGLQAATNFVTVAQNELSKAQEKLSAIELEREEATARIRSELEKLRKEQELFDIQDQIKEQKLLANAIGGDGSVQAKAKKELLRLALEQQLAEKELEFADRISQAEAEVRIAEDKVNVAKQQEEFQKKQYELIQLQIDAIKKQNDLLKEQADLLKPKDAKGGSGGGGGGSKAPEIDKDKKAQDDYNFSVATSAEKLEILRQKLAETEEGSAEYYRVLGQINQVTAQQAREDQKVQDELKAKEKAQRDYEYSLSGTSGKLAILKKELAGVEQGSIEYYRILGEIAQLEKQQSKPKASGGGSGVSLDQTQENPLVKTAQDVQKSTQSIRDGIEQAKESAARFREGISSARQALQDFIAPMQPVIDFFQANFIPILAGLATPAIIGLASVIGGVLVGALTALLSPIALVSAGVALLVAAWQSNFANIQGYTAEIVASIADIISGFLAAVSEFWNKNGASIMAFVTRTWNTIISIITQVVQGVLTVISAVLSAVASFIQNNQDLLVNLITVAWYQIKAVIDFILGTIQGIITTVAGLITGDWDMFGQGLQTIAETFMNFISETIGNVLAGILSFFGVNAEDTKKVWTGLGILLEKETSKFMNAIGTAITIGHILLEAAWENTKRNITQVWDKLQSLLPESITTAIDNILTAVSKALEGVKKSAESVGTSFVDGIVAGIKSKINEIVAAAKSVVNAAIGAANEAQDSNSPSEVMKQSGQDYGDGYILGIKETLSRATSAVTGLVTNMTDMPMQQQLAPAIANSGATYNQTFNIDARGSTMSEQDFKKIIKDEVNTIATRGNNRGR